MRLGAGHVVARGHRCKAIEQAGMMPIMEWQKSSGSSTSMDRAAA